MRNDRWSTPKQIKKMLNNGCESGGLILYSENGDKYKHTGNTHSIILGSTGCGKTKSGSEPYIRDLLLAGESMIVVDPKGELYRNTACFIPGNYVTHVLDFRNIAYSEHYNPLTYPMQLFNSGDPDKKERALNLVDNLSDIIFPVSQNEDPFWKLASRNLFIGIVYSLLEIASPDEVNLASVANFAIKGAEKFGGSNYLKEFAAQSTNPLITMNLETYVNAPNETRGSIASVFMQGVNRFAKSDGIMSLLGSNDFEMEQLDGEKPTAIYIVIPDETAIYNDLCSIIVGQLMEHYIHIAQEKYDGTLPVRMNLVGEEAGNVKIPNLGHLMSAARSRNIRIAIILQNLRQLSELYGENEAANIMENTGIWFVFRVNNWETLDEFSRKCGERDMLINGKTIHERLISPTQLGAMEEGSALVIVKGALKFITKLPMVEKMYPCDEWKPPVRVKRNDYSAPPVFNVKEYVKEVKKKRLLEMMNNAESERKPRIIADDEVQAKAKAREAFLRDTNPFAIEEFRRRDALSGESGKDYKDEIEHRLNDKIKHWLEENDKSDRKREEDREDE